MRSAAPSWRKGRVCSFAGLSSNTSKHWLTRSECLIRTGDEQSVYAEHVACCGCTRDFISSQHIPEMPSLFEILKTIPKAYQGGGGT